MECVGLPDGDQTIARNEFEPGTRVQHTLQPELEGAVANVKYHFYWRVPVNWGGDPIITMTPREFLRAVPT